MNPSAIVYDIEILKAIPNHRQAALDGIEYCNGWQDYKGMGIACIGCYDYRYGVSRVFLKDNFEEFRVLSNSVDAVIGFNNGGFDDLLVKECLGWSIPPERSYDLLSEVWVASGLGRRYAGRQYAGYGLDDLSRANGLKGKTGTGEHAPVAWQRGKLGEVIDYCLNDVWLTKMLVDHCIEKGFLMSPVTKKPLQITTFNRLKTKQQVAS